MVKQARLSAVWLVFMAGIIGLTVLAAVPAQASAQTKIAIVDVKTLSADSEAAKSIEAQAKKLRERFQNSFSQKEKQLRDKQQELAGKRQYMSEEEFTQEKLAFETELLKERQQVQDHRKALQKAAAQSLMTLRDEIIKSVSTVAAKGGYDMVLSGQEVVWSDNAMDITAAVMADMNGRVKKIALEIDQ